MSIIACYNLKGGVGKTAASVNLAYLAARDGARTLLWDLDPQGASSFYFRSKGGQGADSLLKMTRQGRSISSYIEPTLHENLDLLPADLSQRNLDIILESSRHPDRTMNKMLQSVMEGYDYVFLDCPPHLALLTDHVFHSSDVMLVPTIPTTLSLRTLSQITRYRRDDPKHFPRLMAFFSMADRRKTMHKLILDRPPAMEVEFLTSAIPYAAEVERMGIKRQPLELFARTSRPARAYAALWRELKAALEAPAASAPKPAAEVLV